MLALLTWSLSAVADEDRAAAAPDVSADVDVDVDVDVGAQLAELEASHDDGPSRRSFHGFRVGYTYVNPPPRRESPLDSPHLFVIGYELTQRVVGGGWLNVIAVENLTIAGLNQSRFLPSANGLVGFELGEQIQVGTGINLSVVDPDNGRIVHQILAVGWTPRVGALNMPVHVTVIPDVDGQWRAGSTIGVNW